METSVEERGAGPSGSAAWVGGGGGGVGAAGGELAASEKATAEAEAKLAQSLKDVDRLVQGGGRDAEALSEALKKLGVLQSQLSQSEEEVAALGRAKAETDEKLALSLREQERLARAIDQMREDAEKEEEAPPPPPPADAAEDGLTAEEKQALLDGFELERRALAKKAKKEKQRMLTVQAFELEGLRASHATQAKAAERRFAEQLEGAQVAPAARAGARGGAARSRLERTSARRGDRLGATVQELEATLDEERESPRPLWTPRGNWGCSRRGACAPPAAPPKKKERRRYGPATCR